MLWFGSHEEGRREAGMGETVSDRIEVQEQMDLVSPEIIVNNR
jgi:hypothetical protein